jgi:predicted phosphodiesterase
MDNIYDMIISDTHDNKNIRGIKNILDVDNLDYNLYDGDENYKDDDYSYKGVSKLKSNIAYLSE